MPTARKLILSVDQEQRIRAAEQDLWRLEQVSYLMHPATSKALKRDVLRNLVIAILGQET